MKTKLMNTAVRMWKERGYDSVSVTEICRKCGVTKGSFYHHFESKADLLCAYFVQEGIKAEESVQEEVRKSDSSLEKIWALMESHSRVAMELGPELTGVVLRWRLENRELPFSSSGILVEDPGSGTNFLELIEKGQENGEIRKERTPEYLMGMLEASLTGMMFYWIASKQRFSILEQQRELLFLLLKS